MTFEWPPIEDGFCDGCGQVLGEQRWLRATGPGYATRWWACCSQACLDQTTKEPDKTCSTCRGTETITAFGCDTEGHPNNHAHLHPCPTCRGVGDHAPDGDESVGESNAGRTGSAATSQREYRLSDELYERQECQRPHLGDYTQTPDPAPVLPTGRCSWLRATSSYSYVCDLPAGHDEPNAHDLHHWVRIEHQPANMDADR